MDMQLLIIAAEETAFYLKDGKQKAVFAVSVYIDSLCLIYCLYLGYASQEH